MMSANFWETKESLLLLNPRLVEDEQKNIRQAIAENPQDESVWLKSSGTESSGRGHKLVCLSKKAILCAAKSVNQVYRVNSNDCWLNPLPSFHIGGLAISARCFLAGAKEVSFFKWQVDEFIKSIIENKATISSLVPTQVFDLVKSKKRCPESMRFILLGGGALDKEIFLEARNLGWPLIPSYGMTETCALVAGAKLTSLEEIHYPEAETLPHAEFFKVDNKYAIKSPCLFTGFLWVETDGKSQWQQRPDPFVLDDILQINGKIIKVLGRDSELIKILGETVNLAELSSKLDKKISSSFLIIPRQDERVGHQLCLVIEGEDKGFLLQEINQDLMPYERIQSVSYEKSFSRTDLGKIDRACLFKKYQEQ